ncbi:MAG: 4Fe-4S dicluster domain-containing protein [Pirellulaceae bacterium]|nr:4Fe-4S dicluster domain-containing protein [Pirellulaceae bacterium]
MNDDSRPGRDDGVSRRDFVRGRFWRVQRFRNSTGNSTNSKSTNKPTRRIPLVMRYPKTLSEVEQHDAIDPDKTTNTQPLATGTSATGTSATGTSATGTSAAGRHRTIPIMRPPGAIDEASFLEGCTRCDECRKACPHDAIVHAPAQMREASGTPMIQADHQACLMCSDFPCIAACEPDVLTTRVPPVMGTALVTEHLCLAHHGTTCTVCSERCPVDGAIDLDSGKPTVNESTCTGCGMCRYVCPAPENAILLMPAFVRPTPTRNRRCE